MKTLVPNNSQRLAITHPNPSFQPTQNLPRLLSSLTSYLLRPTPHSIIPTQDNPRHENHRRKQQPLGLLPRPPPPHPPHLLIPTIPAPVPVSVPTSSPAFLSIPIVVLIVFTSPPPSTLILTAVLVPFRVDGIFLRLAVTGIFFGERSPTDELLLLLLMVVVAVVFLLVRVMMMTAVLAG